MAEIWVFIPVAVEGADLSGQFGVTDTPTWDARQSTTSQPSPPSSFVSFNLLFNPPLYGVRRSSRHTYIRTNMEHAERTSLQTQLRGE